MRQNQVTNDHSNDPGAEIERLRQEIAELQRAECGGDTPPLRPRKDFAVQEQPSSSSSPSKNNIMYRKCVSICAALALVFGLVLGIILLKDFMKTSDVSFVPDEPGTTQVTLAELALHKTPDDCWMVLYGDVYDLTNYARRHPGGASIVTKLAGSDGTAEYARFHSESLLRSVQGDKIGPFANEGANGGGASAGSTNNGNGVGMTPGEGTASGANDGNSSNGTGSGADCATDLDCISMEDLARHNTPDDCWIAMYGDVYDMTDYAKRHPGGARIVTNLAGTDGTSEYKRFHSRGLLSSVQGTMVGRLEGSGNNNDMDMGQGDDGFAMDSMDSSGD